MGLGQHREAIQLEEDKLLKALSKIYRKIQFDLEKGGATWNEIESIYHQKTDDIIRAAVTSIYELSARKTVERDIKVPYFLTQRDLTEIRRLSQKYQDSFWLSLNREINTHNTLGVKQFYDPKTLMLVRKEDTRLRQGFVGRIAQSIHGEVAAMGVLHKARQVVLQHNVARAVKLLQAATRTRSRRSAAQSSGGRMVKPYVTWENPAHAGLCPQCSALGGTRYQLDDPDTPIPSAHTHPRCTCELILNDASLEDIEEEEAF